MTGNSNGRKPRMGEADELQRLRAALHEELEESEEAESLLPTVQRLRQWAAPTPSEAQRAVLLAALLPAMPSTPESRLARARRRASTLAEWWPGLLLRAQVRVVRREIWVASALVMGLGLFVTLATYGHPAFSTVETLPFVVLAPIVAAIGVAFLYGPMVDPALEIELAAPASPRVVLLARLTLLFGFDLGLGLAGSALLAWFQPGLTLWPLVLAWLAPMAFLSALALLLTTLALDPGLSMLASMAIWTLQNVRSLPTWDELLWYLPNLGAPAAQPWLLGLALLLTALGLWLSGQEERWVSRP